jgi:acyl-CoA thioesterase
VIASSTLTELAPQAELGAAFLRDLFTGATVGEALLAAKRAVTDPDVRKSYLLFGDPSMRVRR